MTSYTYYHHIYVELQFQVKWGVERELLDIPFNQWLQCFLYIVQLDFTAEIFAVLNYIMRLS
jgi:hypothetical protein